MRPRGIYQKSHSKIRRKNSFGFCHTRGFRRVSILLPSSSQVVGGDPSECNTNLDSRLHGNDRDLVMTTPVLSYPRFQAGIHLVAVILAGSRRGSIRKERQPGFPPKASGNDNDEADRFQFEQIRTEPPLRFLAPPCALFTRHCLRGHVQIFTIHSIPDRHMKVNSSVTKS